MLRDACAGVADTRNNDNSNDNDNDNTATALTIALVASAALIGRTHARSAPPSPSPTRWPSRSTPPAAGAS